FSDREIALVGEHGVKRQAPVSLAENKAVALRPLRLLRPMPQDVVVEHADYLDERERRPDVAALTLVDGADDQPAQMKTPLVERPTLPPPEIGRVGGFDRVVHAPRRARGARPASSAGQAFRAML